MKRLKKRCIVLVISYFILIVLLLYYSKTIQNEKVKELQLPKDTKSYPAKELGNEDNILKIVKPNLEKEEQQITQENINVDTYTIENENIDYNKIVKCIGSVEHKYIDIVQEKISTLPQFLVKSFVQEGWNIYITEYDLATQYGYKKGTVLGMTDYNRTTIYIDNREKAVQTAVEHEFGHYLDYISNLPSLNSEFAEIYQEEVQEFKVGLSNPNCVTNPQEFFAEIFACLIADESKCTPQAKEFVETLINKLDS